MAKPTFHSWLLLGIASVVVTSGIQSPAHAQIVVGSGGQVIVTDQSTIPPHRQFSFSEFAGAKLLMPDPTLDQKPHLFLKNPTKQQTIKLVKPGEKPKNGYQLTLPDEEQNIVLTPPPGTKIYLIPPRQKLRAKKKTTTQHKKLVQQTPAPKQATTQILKAEVAASDNSSEAIQTPEETVPVEVKEVATATQPMTATPQTNPQTETSKSAPVSSTPEPSVTQKTEAPLPPETEEVKAEKTVVKAVAPAEVIETPEPPPAPTQVAEIPAPPSIETPAAPTIEKVTEAKTEQLASAPTPEPKQKAQSAIPTDKTTVALVFAPNDARLNDDHRALIKGVIDQLEADPNTAVQLMAYAVASDRSKSRRLSLSRALAVRSYLLKHEVRNTRIQVRAMGDQVKSGKPDRVDLILTRP